jgi:hypothetical protein
MMVAQPTQVAGQRHQGYLCLASLNRMRSDGGLDRPRGTVRLSEEG